MKLLQQLVGCLKIKIGFGLFVFLIGWGCFEVSLKARVYTTRPGNDFSFEDPSTFAARVIYGGQFRVNGVLTEMDILSGSVSAIDTLKLLEAGFKTKSDSFKYRQFQETVLGTVGKGAQEKRFLISPLKGARSCLIFVLHGKQEMPSRLASRSIWPSSLPQLDALQEPQLIVEHLDQEFIFVNMLFPQVSADRAVELCVEKLEREGWKESALTKNGVVLNVDWGFAVLNRKTKTCWIEARQIASGSASVTLVCKAP